MPSLCCLKLFESKSSSSSSSQSKKRTAGNAPSSTSAVQQNAQSHTLLNRHQLQHHHNIIAYPPAAPAASQPAKLQPPTSHHNQQASTSSSFKNSTTSTTTSTSTAGKERKSNGGKLGSISSHSNASQLQQNQRGSNYLLSAAAKPNMTVQHLSTKTIHLPTQQTLLQPGGTLGGASSLAGMFLYELNTNIDKKPTVIEETSPIVLRYKTPYFRANATIILPPIDKKQTWTLGWIQACEKMKFTNSYGQLGHSGWEIPQLENRLVPAVSDSDGISYPWYGNASEIATVCGPTKHYKKVNVK